MNKERRNWEHWYDVAAEYDPDYAEGKSDQKEENVEKTEKPTRLERAIYSSQSFTELEQKLAASASERMQGLLPHSGVTAERLRTIAESWGDLSPLFIYAGKMKGADFEHTQHLVAEMAANMDPPSYTRWKEWRYDAESTAVKRQLGHLSAEQKEQWRTDRFLELGDIEIMMSAADKPAQIRDAMQTAVRHGHIYHPETAPEGDQFIQETLQKHFETLGSDEQVNKGVLQERLRSLKENWQAVDAVIKQGDLEKTKSVLDKLFTVGKIVMPAAKIKNNITTLTRFLPDDLATQLTEAYAALEKSGQSIPAEKLITEDMRTAIFAAASTVEAEAAQAQQSGAWEKYGVDPATKNPKPLYDLRQRLTTTAVLLRLTHLTPQQIALNKLESENSSKKGGASLTRLVDQVHDYFSKLGNEAATQDIANIKAVLAERSDVSRKRRLAMIFTDNPQIGFNIGKYPIGVGSCQNYEGSPSWNKCLAGYVADAKTKFVIMADLNKLPSEIQQAVADAATEEDRLSLFNRHTAAFLPAMVGREIVKVTKDTNRRPVIFLEPTYSSINKGNTRMDQYYNTFVELAIADAMGAKIARGGGKETLAVSGSRNEYEYEDGGYGNANDAGLGVKSGSYNMRAHYVSAKTATEEEAKIVERVRHSIDE